MPRGQHGKDSKYWHIRLRDPKKLKSMRTVDRGLVKQVVGKDKKGNWIDQNIMVKKSHAKQSGSSLKITNEKVRRTFRDKKIPLSNITQRKGGAESDFIVKKVPKCPCSKIRSKGRGQGLGRGKGKGPIGRMK